MKKFKLIVCTLMMFMCVCSTSLFAFGKGETTVSDTNEEQGNGSGPSETKESLNDLSQESSELGDITGSGTDAAENNSKNEQNSAENNAQTQVSQTGGDPVLLTSGQYIQTETDIVLKTLNGSLPVSRFYTSGGSTGGNTLGSKWTGNLETRLIRGVSEGFGQAKTNLEARHA